MSTAEHAEQESAALEVRGISKVFGSQLALDDVSFTLARSRITALLGQNGSGKSTLIKILAGFHSPAAGAQMWVDGHAVSLPAHPRVVHEAGLRFLHQDLALVADFSIADNFALANGYPYPAVGRVARRRYEREVGTTLARFGIDAPPQTPVGKLAPSERTMVAIGRALGDGLEGHRIIVLDEPTASLPEAEVERLLAALRAIGNAGASVIYVSHRIDEVRRIADHVMVLRDGRLVADQELGEMDSAEIIRLIVGRDLGDLGNRASMQASSGREVLLRVRGLCARQVRDLSFELCRGERVGVTGLLGCGRSELARLLAGAQAHYVGSVELRGREVRFRDPTEALMAGVAYVPQDRHGEGAIGDMTLRENVTLSSLGRYWSHARLSRRSEVNAAAALIKRFDVRPPLLNRKMADFSGGNQQKAILARCTSTEPDLFVLDEPTQGVDAGAKQEIGEVIRELSDDGAGVVLCSSDLVELASMCDRVLVLDRGRLIATIAGESLTEDNLTAACATGVSGGLEAA